MEEILEFVMKTRRLKLIAPLKKNLYTTAVFWLFKQVIEIWK